MPVARSWGSPRMYGWTSNWVRAVRGWACRQLESCFLGDQHSAGPTVPTMAQRPSTLTSFLQNEKPRHRVMKPLTPGHTAGIVCQAVRPRSLCRCFCGQATTGAGLGAVGPWNCRGADLAPPLGVPTVPPPLGVPTVPVGCAHQVRQALAQALPSWGANLPSAYGVSWPWSPGHACLGISETLAAPGKGPSSHDREVLGPR